MKSKSSEYKDKIHRLRDKGASFREIAEILNIPKSTISGWFRGIEPTDKQKEIFRRKWGNSLIKARIKAVKWHNLQKENRLKEAERQAELVLSNIKIMDKFTLELALAMLYLGEGSKTKCTSMGNSNPEILKFFIASLVKVYDFDREKIKCELHLRADQDIDEIKNYWSKELNISLKNFTAVQVDKRTSVYPTFTSYKGVCVVQCGNIAFQRRLVSLSQKFCREVVDGKGFEPLT